MCRQGLQQIKNPLIIVAGTRECFLFFLFSNDVSVTRHTLID